MQANAARWRLATVSHRLRSPSAREEGDFSLPGPVKDAILASKRPGIWRMSAQDWHHRRLLLGPGAEPQLPRARAALRCGYCPGAGAAAPRQTLPGESGKDGGGGGFWAPR